MKGKAGKNTGHPKNGRKGREYIYAAADKQFRVRRINSLINQLEEIARVDVSKGYPQWIPKNPASAEKVKKILITIQKIKRGIIT